MLATILAGMVLGFLMFLGSRFFELLGPFPKGETLFAVAGFCYMPIAFGMGRVLYLQGWSWYDLGVFAVFTLSYFATPGLLHEATTPRCPRCGCRIPSSA